MEEIINNPQQLLYGYELTAGVSKTRWNNSLKRNIFTPSRELIDIVSFFNNLMNNPDPNNLKNNRALKISVVNLFVNEIEKYIRNSLVLDLGILKNNQQPLIDLIRINIKERLLGNG